LEANQTDIKFGRLSTLMVILLTIIFILACIVVFWRLRLIRQMNEARRNRYEDDGEIDHDDIVT